MDDDIISINIQLKSDIEPMLIHFQDSPADILVEQEGLQIAEGSFRHYVFYVCWSKCFHPKAVLSQKQYFSQAFGTSLF